MYKIIFSFSAKPTIFVFEKAISNNNVIRATTMQLEKNNAV